VLFQSLLLHQQQQNATALSPPQHSLVLLLVDHDNVGMIHYQISDHTMISFFSGIAGNQIQGHENSEGDNGIVRPDGK
jgi:hypothetical protein